MIMNDKFAILKNRFNIINIIGVNKLILICFIYYIIYIYIKM